MGFKSSEQKAEGMRVAVREILQRDLSSPDHVARIATALNDIVEDAKGLVPPEKPLTWDGRGSTYRLSFTGPAANPTNLYITCFVRLYAGNNKAALKRLFQVNVREGRVQWRNNVIRPLPPQHVEYLNSLKTVLLATTHDEPEVEAEESDSDVSPLAGTSDIGAAESQKRELETPDEAVSKRVKPNVGEKNASVTSSSKAHASPVTRPAATDDVEQMCSRRADEIREARYIMMLKRRFGRGTELEPKQTWRRVLEKTSRGAGHDLCAQCGTTIAYCWQESCDRIACPQCYPDLLKEYIESESSEMSTKSSSPVKRYCPDHY